MRRLIIKQRQIDNILKEDLRPLFIKMKFVATESTINVFLIIFSSVYATHDCFYYVSINLLIIEVKPGLSWTMINLPHQLGRNTVLNTDEPKLVRQ